VLTILSWNIQQGGGSRIRDILNLIRNQRAQILVLSEFRNNRNGALIRGKLLSMGYLFQFVSLAESDVNSVLIASKLPCSSKLFINLKMAFNHTVICVEFEAFKCYGVYLPHKKKHQLFELLKAEVTSEKPSIIMGDFNTGINGVDQKGNSFWYTAELKRLEKANMRDAFRYIHGDAETYSWYSHQGNGFRYDHIYIHQDLLAVVEGCEYIHEARVQKWSDHSPMVLNLK